MAERFVNILVDLDGTLCATGKPFKDKHTEAQAYLAIALDVPEEKIRSLFNDNLRSVRALAFVNPHRLLSLTLRELRLTFPGYNNHIWRHAEDYLYEVYTRPVESYPEVQEVTKSFFDEGYRIGVVTQAEKTWTEQVKMPCLGIAEYLVYKRAFCARTYVPKDRFSWLNGAYFYGFMPAETAVVGDNLIDDANAARLAGFGLSCWLNRVGEKVWSHQDDHVPEKGVIEIPDLWQFLQLVRRGRDLNPR